jgi:hypothetical protein
MIAAFGIILTAILAYLRKQSSDLQEMREKVAVLQTQVSPLWAQIQARISMDLHHPHPRYGEMDKLLEKLEALTITVEERERLGVLLDERSVDMHEDISEVQRKEAKLMVQVMQIVIMESKGLSAIILGWLALHFWR